MDDDLGAWPKNLAFTSLFDDISQNAHTHCTVAWKDGGKRWGGGASTGSYSPSSLIAFRAYHLFLFLSWIFITCICNQYVLCTSCGPGYMEKGRKQNFS